MKKAAFRDFEKTSTALKGTMCFELYNRRNNECEKFDQTEAQFFVPPPWSCGGDKFLYRIETSDKAPSLLEHCYSNDCKRIHFSKDCRFRDGIKTSPHFSFGRWWNHR